METSYQQWIGLKTSLAHQIVVYITATLDQAWMQKHIIVTEVFEQSVP